MTVLGATAWTSNAAMIAACAQLGYLKRTDVVLDPTYGKGNWWKRWCPDTLVFSDLKAGIDFRQLPHGDHSFDAAVFDPPYTCVGGRDTTGIPEFFDRFGLTDAPKTPAALTEMNQAGLKELLRVMKPSERKRPRYVLVKCADYVWSGKLYLGTHIMLNYALELGFECWDRLIYVGHERQQPRRTRRDGTPSVQQHARQNWSMLLVLRVPR